MKKPVASLGLLLLSSIAITRADEIRLRGLSGDVDVKIDAHGIPHVFAESWSDAARALGYLHARDRLWQMEVFRRMASGTLSEVLGRNHLESDILARQLEFRRSTGRLWGSADFPGELRGELLAYAAGVNARIEELGATGLPEQVKKLGYRLAPWSPIDSLVFSKYMGWDQSGTDTDLWLGRMAEKLGVAAIEELWPLDRPYEVPAVATQSTRPKTAFAPMTPVPGAERAIAAAERHLSGAAWLGRGGSFGSNNWAVDGTKTRSGKPILASDPHLGFQIPSIWYSCHVSVKGRSVAGATFPVSPVVIIGHNDRIAWGVTNLQADAVDYYIETLKSDDPLQYRHRGEWKRVDQSIEEIAVRGEAPHRLTLASTVHGPIISRDGKAISLAWTGLAPTRDVVAFWRINHAQSLREFLEALDDLAVPALNMVYADVEGNIALHPSGALPLRTPGQGRIPMEGASGDNDWAGMIPRKDLPLAINPASHFVASANGRPASTGYPHYLGWMWDPSYRARHIHEMLATASDLTVETMAPLQNDALDKAAASFLPPMLEALGRSKLEGELARSNAAALQGWNYVARGETIAPTVWMEWFSQYREAVWDDEWQSRGIEKEHGSWGFTGDNHREPMLEVLEYMTREHPRSAWFDDKSTPERETRDEIVVRSFAKAVQALEKRLGADTRGWAWSKLNLLHVRSITGEPALARSGVAVPGTAFTVNPGGDTGPVTSGASFRMIVDLSDTANSVGVYPGGQSDDPSTPTYDDQIAPWARGEYLPLHAVRDAKSLPSSANVRALRFVP